MQRWITVLFGQDNILVCLSANFLTNQLTGLVKRCLAVALGVERSD